jgi:hypothetical protein
MRTIKVNCLSIFGDRQEEQYDILKKMEFTEMQLGKIWHLEENFIKSICTLDTLSGELYGFFYNIKKPNDWDEATHFLINSSQERIEVEVRIDENGEPFYFINTFYMSFLMT